jgi:predicted amidophosphoribosyltransferase
MFEGFKDRFRMFFVNMMKKEISSFIDRLKVVDDEEVGELIAIITHQRHSFLKTKGFDLCDPVATILKYPTVVINLHNVAKCLSKENYLKSKAGIMVWIHTLRAADNPEMFMKGLDMWCELERGFNHAESGKKAIESKLKVKICIDGYNFNPLKNMIRS